MRSEVHTEWLDVVNSNEECCDTFPVDFLFEGITHYPQDSTDPEDWDYKESSIMFSEYDFKSLTEQGYRIISPVGAVLSTIGEVYEWGVVHTPQAWAELPL